MAAVTTPFTPFRLYPAILGEGGGVKGEAAKRATKSTLDSPRPRQEWPDLRRNKVGTVSRDKGGLYTR